jgi:hypothetical protein
MEFKMNDTKDDVREYFRMRRELWIQVYVGTVSGPTKYGHDYATMANKAVDEFDKKFKNGRD